MLHRYFHHPFLYLLDSSEAEEDENWSFTLASLFSDDFFALKPHTHLIDVHGVPLLRDRGRLFSSWLKMRNESVTNDFSLIVGGRRDFSCC